MFKLDINNYMKLENGVSFGRKEDFNTKMNTSEPLDKQ